MFTIIEGAIAITQSKGVFRQVKVYHHNKRIYVGYGGGFIAVGQFLHGAYSTSVPSIRIVEIEVTLKTKITGTGFMVTEDYVEELQTAEQANKAISGNYNPRLK